MDVVTCRPLSCPSSSPGSSVGPSNRPLPVSSENGDKGSADRHGSFVEPSRNRYTPSVSRPGYGVTFGPPSIG
jgi:hypothetical protein